MKLSYLAIASMLLSSSCTVLFGEGDGGEPFDGADRPLYRFDFETDDELQISSGTSSLSVQLQGNASIRDGSLDLRLTRPGEFGHLRSSTPADDSLEACQASDAMTIAAWITPTGGDALENIPSRIITVEDIIDDTTNFTLGQGGSGSKSYDVFTVRVGDRREGIETDVFTFDRNEPMFVFFTMDQGGNYRFHAGAFSEAGLSTLHYDEWIPGSFLTIGAASGDERGWQGLIHHIEFYCRALDLEEEAALREATDPR